MIARRDGYKCRYCSVPTAATIEHMTPLSKDGRSVADNLCLACPYCNNRKGERDAQAFIDSGDWRMEAPDSLPATTALMLAEMYGAADKVATGSSHARLHIEDGQVILLVRPSRHEDWQRLRLGAEDHPRVVAASFDFLERHYAKRFD